MDEHGVAPLAGAWIEIFSSASAFSLAASLPSRERGLKSTPMSPRMKSPCRSPRGSVD